MAAIGEGNDGATFDVELFPLIRASIGAFEQAAQRGNIIVGERNRKRLNGGMILAQKCRQCAGEKTRADAFALAVFANDTHGDAGNFIVWIADKQIDSGNRLIIPRCVVYDKESLENAGIFDLGRR